MKHPKMFCVYTFLFIAVFTSCQKPGSQAPDLRPSITRFSPLIGKEGTEVIVTGINFSANAPDNVVDINGTRATITTATTTQLTIVVPTGATSGKISITNGAFTAVSAETFTVKSAVKKNLSRISLSRVNTTNLAEVMEWQYDGLKRVVEVTATGQFPSIVVNSKVKFHYTGNETRPYLIESLPQTATQQIGLDTYITYGPDGRKIKDSSIFKHPACGNLLYLANYTYASDLVYVEYKSRSINYTCSTIPVTRGYDTIYLASGNVSRIVQNGSQNTSAMNTYSYSPDDKINPFQQLNIFSSFYTIGFDVGYRYWLNWQVDTDNLYMIGLNKNNPATIQRMTGSHTQQFSYSYDNDDYPVSATITTTAGTLSTVVKVTYEYVQ